MAEARASFPVINLCISSFRKLFSDKISLILSDFFSFIASRNSYAPFTWRLPIPSRNSLIFRFIKSNNPSFAVVVRGEVATAKDSRAFPKARLSVGVLACPSIPVLAVE
ncbi:MAG: hypothetical protein LBF42_02875 [Puniceicoccales bacterium]|nr:hypothetical protein [Puniceicoccales bacterium]